MNHSSENIKWQPLLNGKDLTGWDTFLGPRYDTVQNKWDTIPVGLNVDPLNVFSVVDLSVKKSLEFPVNSMEAFPQQGNMRIFIFSCNSNGAIFNGLPIAPE